MDDDSERSTWKYGILTIAINWIPGFVAAVHIIAMYRHRYSPSKTIVAAGIIFCTLFLYLHNSMQIVCIKWTQIPYLFILVLAIFLYPVIPLLSYIRLLWKKQYSPYASSLPTVSSYLGN